MKKIIIASALVFGALFACQKPSELDNLESSKVNSSRYSNDDILSNNEKESYFNATLVALKGDKNNDVYATLFEKFPDVEEIYEYDLNKNVRLNFLTVSLSSNVHEQTRSFSFQTVQDPITIIDNIRRKYRVCSLSTDPKIECVSQRVMQDIVHQALTDAGHNVYSVNVSVNGDIVVAIRRPTSTLGSCIATIISYFN